MNAFCIIQIGCHVIDDVTFGRAIIPPHSPRTEGEGEGEEARWRRLFFLAPDMMDACHYVMAMTSRGRSWWRNPYNGVATTLTASEELISVGAAGEEGVLSLFRKGSAHRVNSLVSSTRSHNASAAHHNALSTRTLPLRSLRNPFSIASIPPPFIHSSTLIDPLLESELQIDATFLNCVFSDAHRGFRPFITHPNKINFAYYLHVSSHPQPKHYDKF